MRLILVIAGVVAWGLGIALCIPGAVIIWREIASRHAGRRASFADFIAGRMSHHSDYTLHIGDLTVSGWHLWALLGGMAGVGAVLILGGVYVLFLRPAKST